MTLIEQYSQERYIRGRAEGRTQGITQGRTETTKAMVKRLLAQAYSVEDITHLLGLDHAVVNKIKASVVG